MDSDNLQYISEGLKSGKTKESIYQELLAQGLTLEGIERLFIQATSAADDKEEASRQTIRVIATIGALLIGLGIFSFIAANWQAMTRESKVAVVVGAMIVVDGLGWWLREKIKLAKSGEAMIFLGSLLFGGAVFLGAQMYNTRVFWPDGFLWWTLGILAVTAAVKLDSLYFLAIFTGFIGLVWYPLGLFWGGFYHPLLFTPWLLLLFAAAALWIIGWKFRQKFISDFPKRY